MLPRRTFHRAPKTPKRVSGMKRWIGERWPGLILRMKKVVIAVVVISAR
jgi:hypothetical protein